MNAATEPLQFTAGIIHGLDIDAYHSGPGISKTGLDRINRSPAYFYAMSLDPNRPPEKGRAGQLEGTLAHCAVLEPAEFANRYAVPPPDAPRKPTEAQWNAKKPGADSIAAMDWWRDWTANNGGKQVITAAQYDVAMRQAESIRKLPDIAEALAAGDAESSAFWIDPETGALCRCRPDWAHPVGESGSILIDIKTYSDASREEFARQIARKRYHVQDRFYSDGYSIAAKRDVLAFIFVAVETEWPYAASAVMLNEQSRYQGAADYRRNLDTYAACLKSNQWPGYSSGIEIASLPAWALTE